MIGPKIISEAPVEAVVEPHKDANFTGWKRMRPGYYCQIVGGRLVRTIEVEPGPGERMRYLNARHGTMARQ